MGTLSLWEALCPTVQAFIQHMWSPCFYHVDEKQGSPGVTQWELWHLGNVIDEFCPPTEELHGERGLQKPNSQGTFQAKHLECNSESAELCQTQLDRHTALGSHEGSPPARLSTIKMALFPSGFLRRKLFWQHPRGKGSHTSCKFLSFPVPWKKAKPQGHAL